MRQFSAHSSWVIVVGLMSVFHNRDVCAFERPSEIRVAMGKTGFFVQLTWDKEPNFPAGSAVEFEIHVADKCFAMPPGGKDNSISIPIGDTNLPGVPYKDVWNYYEPPDGQTAAHEIATECHDPILAAGALADYDKLR